MVVVEELAAELQVELVAELPDPLPDVGGLELQIFLIVEAGPVHRFNPSHFVMHSITNRYSTTTGAAPQRFFPVLANFAVGLDKKILQV